MLSFSPHMLFLSGLFLLSSTLSSSDSSSASGCSGLDSFLLVSSSVSANLPLAMVYLIAAATACRFDFH